MMLHRNISGEAKKITRIICRQIKVREEKLDLKLAPGCQQVRGVKHICSDP